MRVVRLYTPQKLALEFELELDDDIRHYALNVLRINKRSSLTLFNGDGYDYQCEILDCSKAIFRARITQRIKLQNESSLTTHLYLSVSKSSHMDYAIQKSVEAGVSCIQPIGSERTVIKTTDKSAKNKHQHWLGIINSACEQCGRAVIPKLLPITEFDKLAPLNEKEVGLIFDADAAKTMNDINIDSPSSIKILIGPEGGFTENEAKQALQKGFQSVRCGPRILRTETAALTAVIIAQQLWGDLAG